MARILCVDDEPDILVFLKATLTNAGHQVTTAADAESAFARVLAQPPQLVITDVMMPGESGFDLAKSIRTGSQVPILMLTARSDADDRITGLEIGADDYIPKPFDPRELVLRINNVLKRTTAPVVPTIELVHFGDFIFHLERGELTRSGKSVRITERECEMLRVLAARAGETVPRLDLAAPGTPSSERAVDVQVNRLRRKIEKNPTDPAHLRTVRGIGYRLVATP